MVGGTKVSANSQGTPTQLHQHQVWVFRCQISQLLWKETQKQSAGGGCDAKSNAKAPTVIHSEGWGRLIWMQTAQSQVLDALGATSHLPS